MTETASSAPAALLTFLIADVRGYTSFTVERGDEAAARFAMRFAALVAEGAKPHGGEVIELRGDEALVVFPSAREALRAAVDMQGRFAEETAADPSLPLRVGIGLDAGEAVPVDGGYRGAALNLAARLCGLAGPGEVLASETVTNLARRMEGLQYIDRGATELKGFADRVTVIQIEAAEERDAAQREEMPVAASPAQKLPIAGFLGSLPAGSLVAREEELRRAVEAVGAVEHSEGRFVLLSGEPGIGKTRLAQEITLEARNRGFLISSGRCYEPEQVVPYYPFREALAMLHDAAPSSLRAELPARWEPLLQLLPGQIAAQPAGMGGQEEQQRLFYAVAGFVQAVAVEAPVALLLDDIHWADESSLKLLHFLARQMRGGRVLLLSTYRDVEVGRQHPLERALRDLNREGLTEEIPVRRFDREGTARLTAATFSYEEISEEFAELLHRHTEGNPFFTHEVLRALVERGDLYRANGRWERRELEEIEVPKSIRSAVGERLSRLPDETQAILTEASVLGQAFGFDDLQALGDRDEEQVEGALEEAEAAGLARSVGRDQYTFNHALTQQVLYEEVSPRKRRRLHLAAGEAIERGRHPERRASELAWHFLQGDDPEKALRYSLEAGADAAGVYAFGEAEHHYRAALELARELEDTPAKARALEGLGEVLTMAARYDEAMGYLAEADGQYRQNGDREGSRRSLAYALAVMMWGGRTHQVLAGRAEELMRDEEPSIGLAHLLTQWADLLWATGRWSESLETAERASAIAAKVGADFIRAEAEVRRGTIISRTDGEQGARVLHEAIALAEAAGNLDTLGRGLNNRAAYHMYAGELEDNLRYRQRALETATRANLPASVAWGHVMLSQALRLLGRLEEAGDQMERAVELFGGLEPSWYYPYMLTETGWLQLHEGRWEEAEASLDQAYALARGHEDAQGTAFARVALAELDLALGRPERIIERFEVASRETMHEWELAPAAEAYLAVGNDSRAEALAREALDHGHFYEAEGRRVLAMLHRSRREWDAAEEQLREALDLTRTTGHAVGEGGVLHEYGIMLAARGERERAIGRLREASALFRRIGAHAYTDRTERALAGLAEG